MALAPGKDTLSNGTSGKVLSPSILAHIVLRTNNLPRLRDWWLAFLGAKIAHGNDNIVFIRYDHEHHRIGIIQNPHVTEHKFDRVGLEHIAFTFDTLADLCTAYKQRKAIGMEPVWCVNHGITTSMYYCDPDGNNIETQVDNMDSAAADAFMSSPEFAKNALGADYDPEWLCEQIEKGVSEEELKRPVDVGPRADYAEIGARMHRPSAALAAA